MSNNQITEQAVVVSQTTLNPNLGIKQLALFDQAGEPIDLDGATPVSQTGQNILLTGFSAGSAGNVEATDTVNQALAKLEARLAALEEG